MRIRWCVLILALLSSAFAQTKHHAVHAAKAAAAKMPVTTSSTEARKHFDKAMQDLQEVRLDDLADELRAATKADPNFAQAWILLAHFTHNPDEQQLARSRAQATARHVTSAEQLLVKWFTSAQEDNLIPAIAAMNDLLAMFPRDYELATLAGGWLLNQQRYEQSITALERAVTAAPDYAAAYNELGYAYALTGNYCKAIPAMERYVALTPDQPNPYDSYGEILRMAGKFDASLEQYRKSIQMDPMFGSELGVADTYAVMGRQDEARDEYARAIVFARSEKDKVDFQLKSAVTWIRADNRKQAEKAIREAARHAHAAGLALPESEAHRILALYQPDYKLAVKELDAAENVLSEPHPLSRADHDEQHARILLVRVLRGTEAQVREEAGDAATQLEKMAASSRSQVIQLAYHAAQGAVLLESENYSDAISHLQEDSEDPLALRLLWRAYTACGKKNQADSTASKLAAMNLPTPEQALVVPQFRASLVPQAQTSER